jgi:hypothetical protein
MTNLQDTIDEIMQGLPPSLFSLKIPQDLEHPNYIQHIASDVDNAQNKFVELIDSILGTNYTGKEINRHGIIGRVLDDSGHEELYQTWHRFMCIDKEYREWSQPYFAMNEQKEYLSTCVNKNPQLVAYFRDKKLNEILMESDLQKSIKNLMSIYSDEKRIDKFARSLYYENSPKRPDQGWQAYSGYTILDENNIRIEYKYGAGDMEFEGSFKVNLIPYYRDEKLKEVE